MSGLKIRFSQKGLLFGTVWYKAPLYTYLKIELKDVLSDDCREVNFQLKEKTKWGVVKRNFNLPVPAAKIGEVKKVIDSIKNNPEVSLFSLPSTWIAIILSMGVVTILFLRLLR